MDIDDLDRSRLEAEPWCIECAHEPTLLVLSRFLEEKQLNKADQSTRYQEGKARNVLLVPFNAVEYLADRRDELRLEFVSFHRPILTRPWVMWKEKRQMAHHNIENNYFFQPISKKRLPKKN